jgi:glycosyltransferase involved in cell wall biosynthesis
MVPAIDGFRPHIVVASSVDRWAWRRINAVCRAAGVPTALYIREEASVEHLGTGSLPSLLVSNTPSLAARMTEQGHECAFVPSVVDLGATATESSRRVVLAINPIPMKGVDVVWDLVARLPQIPFVLQEAWTLSESDADAVRTRAAAHSNVELRRASAPGPQLYGDARVLLAPYLVDSRPRVVLEAQANGIPVLASDLPSLVDAVGAGGVTLPLDSMDPWVDTITALWNDGAQYSELAAAARLHAARPEVDPDAVAMEFESLVRQVLAAKEFR